MEKIFIINIFLFLCALSDFFFGGLILIKKYRQESGRAFAFFCWLLGLWTFGILAFRLTDNMKLAYFWNQEFIFTAGLVPVALVHFIRTFVGKPFTIIGKIVLYCPIAILLLIGVLTEGALIQKIVIQNWGKESILGYAYPLFGVYFGVYSLYAFWQLLQALIVAKGQYKMQLIYIFLAAALTLSVGTYFNLILILLGNYRYIWVGPYCTFFLITVSTYAITKYRLMDIKLVLTYAGVFLLVYSIVLGIPFWFGYNYKKWQTTTMFIFVLASIGPFIYRWLIKQTNRKLAYKEKAYQEKLSALGRGMVEAKTKQELFDLFISCYTIENPSYMEAISLYFKNKEDGNYHLAIIKGGVENEKNKIVPIASPLGDYIYQHKDGFFHLEEITKKNQKIYPEEKLLIKAIHDQMESLKLLLIFPLWDKKEDNLLGFLGLDYKRGAQDYTNGDLFMFKMIARNMVAGIKNIKNLQEQESVIKEYYNYKQTQELGMMAAGIGEQLVNNFSIMNSQTKEIFAGDDVWEKIESISQEFADNMRRKIRIMQSSIEQAISLVMAVKDYPKKDIKKLEKINLIDILPELITMAKTLRFKRDDENIMIDLKIEDNLPLVKGIKKDLQEIFLNLINNAIDAVREREAGDKSYINKSIEIIATYLNKRDLIEVRVKDNGIGIPEDKLKNLFVPFHTTKASSALRENWQKQKELEKKEQKYLYEELRGTGLGLFVIRKMIVEAGHGELEVESKYGIGTTFVVRLPVFI